MAEKKQKGVYIVCAAIAEDGCDTVTWLPDAHFPTEALAIEAVFKYISTEYMTARDLRDTTIGLHETPDKLQVVLEFLYGDKHTKIDYKIQFLTLA